MDKQEPLGLSSALTTEDISKSYRKCQRAARLLANADFLSWWADVEEGKKRQIRHLISNGEAGDKKRGIILAIERLYSELLTQADSLEEVGRRLEEHEQRKQPVDRNPWLR